MAEKKKKKWIQGMHLKKGAFTRKAKAHGMSVQEYARFVTRKGSSADTTTKREAVLAKTFAEMRK